MMIRTKAKSLLLSFMLVLACFTFFACKEETKIEVESIAFKETSISLLVGQEYAPEIKILPSYASDRSYKLISDDITALEINGGTIKALKAAVDVKLKVVSNDNDSINDVITVDIYNEPIQLNAPTSLAFDGGKFTFVKTDNASSYVLSVNGTEINIGNNLEYSFENLAEKIASPYNTVLNCSMKAIGDGRVFEDSQYSEQISFVKLSKVEGLKIENKTLFFNTIENVASYTVSFSNGTQTTLPNINFKQSQLTLDLAMFTDSDNGAEHKITVVPNIEDYNADDSVVVYNGEEISIDYIVIGKVKNLAINDKIVSWDFVKNAENYTIKLYKNEVLINTYQEVITNCLQISYEEAGQYKCEILANSTKQNTTTGQVYSSPLKFSMLQSPNIVISNNSVTWTNVFGAEGYLVTIKNSEGAILINNKFVLETSYNVSEFSAGTYTIEVIACGNGENGQTETAVISSKISAPSSWTILNGLTLFVKDEVLYWRDSDASSLNKYRVKFGTVDTVLTNAVYNETEQAFSYDLKTYNFEPGTHTLTVQNLGGKDDSNLNNDNIFDANENNVSIIKLEEGSFASLINKQFTINAITNIVNCEIKIYKAGETEEFKTLNNRSGYKFDLDDSDFPAGNYVARVFVFGNGINIFDADNGDVGTIINFEKLATPNLSIDYTNLKLNIESITGAEEYKLTQNTSVKTVEKTEDEFIGYDLSGLTAGDYSYRIQAKGDGKTVLDSAISSEESAIKVKKLATPTIKFDKDAKTFEIACIDEDLKDSSKNFVKDYTFTINDDVVAVSNNIANCAEKITTADEYKVKVFANPKSLTAGYNGVNLVICSAINEMSVSKLDGLCSIEVVDKKLVVTPKISLTSSDSLQVRIENGANDIVLDNFTNSRTYFEIDIYDNNYNLKQEKLAPIIAGAGEYHVYTTIARNDSKVVTSNEFEVVDKNTLNNMAPTIATLKVLGKVSTIAKNGQSINFNVVLNATNYKAIISVNNRDSLVELTDKYTTNTVNNLTIVDLLQIMKDKGISYSANKQYSIKFISISDDNTTLANKGDISYTFEFLNKPVLSVVEEENNAKVLRIENNDINSGTYHLMINQNDESVVDNKNLEKTAGEFTLYKDINTLSTLVDGNVDISVIAQPTSGDYFNSELAELQIIKLKSEAISVVNGILQWNAVANAKQYNLVYSNGEGSGTIKLVDGSENFAISGGVCTYNTDEIKELESESTDFYLQVDSQVKVGNSYYLNSNNGTITEGVYKLQPVAISVKNGKIHIEIKTTDLLKITRASVKVDDVDIDLDITKTQMGLVDIRPGIVVTGITIAPELLLNYGVDSLLEETLTIKLYANEGINVLNSSTASKTVQGLIKPYGLDISTSITNNDLGVINEVFENIVWNNPVYNLEYVSKYEIVINYNDTDYIFYTQSTETNIIMPNYCDYDANDNGELDFDEDINGNGILEDGEDVNGNGVLDKVEVVFGAGRYLIKVKALTDNSNNVVNSEYCDEIEVNVLETPTGFVVTNGDIDWADNNKVEYYLVKVYLLKDGEKKLLASTRSSKSEIDLTKLDPLETGVYGITAQAMHNNAKILASKESEVLQVIRLPQVESYYVDDGELYITMHEFYTRAEIYLTDLNGNTLEEPFVMDNSSAIQYGAYVFNPTFTDWASSDIISTYQDIRYVKPIKYTGEDGATLRNALAQGYTVSIKLFGNTTSMATPFGIISTHTSEPYNTYLYENGGIEIKGESEINWIEKLPTPNIQVSETDRGAILMGIDNSTKYSGLTYYKIGEKALRGVHLYNVCLTINKTEHIFYVAEVIDENLLNSSLSAIGKELVYDGKDKSNLVHFEYNGITFNVLERKDGMLMFNFNQTLYAYYTPGTNIEGNINPGEYTTIKLENGGKFIMNARFIGDDSFFVQSNLTQDIKIQRYNSLNPTITNGSISWLNQVSEDDWPIYVLTLSNKYETFNIVLYNPNVEYEEGKKYNEEYLLKCLDSGKEYIFDTINEKIEDEIIVYKGLADIVDKARAKNPQLEQYIGKGGGFTASVKAHYTDSTSMDIILAQGGTNPSLSILPQPQLSIENGSFKWKMSSVTTSGESGESIQYIHDYALQVFDGESQVYEIKLEFGDYTYSSGVATYNLTKEIIDSQSGLDFVNNKYIFKVVALGNESLVYIDSKASSIDNAVSMLPTLEARMENGVIVWENNSGYNAVEVYISYDIGSATITLSDSTDNNFYNLPIALNDSSSTYRYLTSGYDYKIKVRLKGNSGVLNGLFSDIIITDEVYPQRLEKVDYTNIVASQGKLTWEPNLQYENITYTVVYSTDNGITWNATGNLEINEFDFAGVENGKIKVKIITNHNDNFSSYASDTNDLGDSVASKLVEVFKLDIPQNITKNDGEALISWDKVQDDNGNDINNYMVRITEGESVKTYNCDTNAWVITGVASTGFKIAVKAVSVSENDEIINGEFSQDVSMTLPNGVDVETFTYDDELKAFKWKAIVGEETDDKYYFGYSYKNADDMLPMPEEYEVTIVREIDGEKWYYFYPSKIGTYISSYVQVKRAGSLASQRVYCLNENGGEFILTFDIFSSGDGVANPYVISNETQLRNVKYFLNAKYEISASFALLSAEPITTSEQVFTGQINGGGHTISLGNITIESDAFNTYEGLFNVVGENAVFTNIRLSNFKVKGYLNSDELYVGILAGYATNATFNQITIVSSTIEIIKSTEQYSGNSVNMYVGGVVGYAVDCVFVNCGVSLGSNQNVTINIKGNSNTLFAFGGIAGYAHGGVLQNNTSNSGNAFVISKTISIASGSSNSPNVYIGALLGMSENETVLDNNNCWYAEADSVETQITQEIGRKK